jgi:hypothetical protein
MWPTGTARRSIPWLRAATGTTGPRPSGAGRKRFICGNGCAKPIEFDGIKRTKSIPNMLLFKPRLNYCADSMRGLALVNPANPHRAHAHQRG